MKNRVTDPAAAIQYFLERVEITSLEHCWQWKLSTGSHGYGQLFWDGRVQTAHRFSYHLFRGDPGKLQINHKCGNKRCCNPAHIYAGTQLENFKDMLQHGTHVPPPLLKGEQIGNAALTDQQASEIKQALLAGSTRQALATQYGVSVSTVSLISRNLRYAHVEPFIPQSCKRNRPTVTAEQVAEVKARLAEGETGQHIASAVGLDATTVSRIKYGRIKGKSTRHGA